MERPPIGWCRPQNSRDPCRSNRPREKQMNRMRTAIAVLSAGLAVSVLPVTAAAAGVNGWFVDEATNSLVVELGTPPDRATQAFLAQAHGVTVRTTHTEQARPLFNVRGGDAWFGPGFRCPVGFSARTSGGAKR